MKDEAKVSWALTTDSPVVKLTVNAERKSEKFLRRPRSN